MQSKLQSEKTVKAIDWSQPKLLQLITDFGSERLVVLSDGFHEEGKFAGTEVVGNNIGNYSKMWLKSRFVELELPQTITFFE